jgi:hypothetical protein
MSLADAEAQLSVRQRFRIAKARSQRLLARGKPDQPRDSNGKWTSGGDAGDDGDAEGKAQFDSRKDFLSDEAWNSDWELHNKIYGVLIDAADSGPYDGGCVIMAQALQKVVGGDVVGLTSANGRVQHAVVKTGDTYHDYSGSGSLKAVMGHLNKLESLDPAHRVVAARPMKKDDLPGAPRDDTVASEIASLIKMHKAIRSLNEKLFDESQHPRDDHGRWTDAGGGDDGDGESKPSGGEHPGEGYSAQATLKDGVIHTSNVYDAVRALHEGRKVELDQPRTVSVLLDKLGEIAKDMIAKGEKAPTFDLCNVTIKGTNLFCADAKGIPRVEMPQLTKQQDEPFFKYLQAQGHSIEREEQYASYLRATQAELNGAKVSAIAAAMRSAAGYDSNPIFVSNDDYILDGHHRWAAEIGNDARDNVLGNDKKMAIFRVDMNIIQLMEEAEKFTGGEGKLSVADEARRKAWLAARVQALALLRAFDPSEPRDDAGKWTSGGGGESESKPSGGKSGKKAKKEDFDKAKVALPPDKAAQDAFIEKWNDKVGVDPATFKTNFMGGLDGPMRLSATGDQININGEIHDSDGKALGNFERNINLDSKSAYSAYFKLNKSATKHDTGKKLLAGNIDTYKKLGVEQVRVTANIDVGGYAWAKYGYIPTQDAWNSLRTKLESKLTGGSSSASSRPRSDNTIEADDWSMLSDDVQSDVRDRWMNDTRDEFISSEEQNWRESGQAKDDAKRELADDFTNYQVATGDVPAWVDEALDGARKYFEDRGQPEIPYSNRQLYDAVELTYESNRGDGEDDPDIGFDDKMLQEPTGYDPNQPTLPGIEPEDPSQRLTQAMRDRIERRMVAAFDKKAEDDAQEMDAPSYLADSVSEYQDDYWDQKSDREKLQHAIDYGMADIEIEPDEEDEEPQQEMELPSQEEADPLLAAVRSSDPKSIWKVADSPKGKDLLLGTGWSGILNLKDKEQMDRFNKYVGKNA